MDIQKIETSWRLTKVTTEDYGHGAGKRIIGQLSRIPDGRSWDALPQVFNIAVPEEARVGSVYRMTLEQQK